MYFSIIIFSHDSSNLLYHICQALKSPRTIYFIFLQVHLIIAVITGKLAIFA